MSGSTAVIIAALAAVAGLVLRLAAHRLDKRSFRWANLVAWLFIILFPVVLLYVAFPDSEASGSFASFKVGGAFAAYVALLVWCTRRSQDAFDQDAAEREIADLKKRLEVSEAQKADIGKAPRIPSGNKLLFKVKASPKKRIGLLSGSVEDVTDADVLVSSENTNMQMARFYDRSVSGTIRYLGAERDHNGHVLKDTIAEELARQRGDTWHVEPAVVYETGPGSLADVGVKRVLHVAAVQGSFGSGYKPVESVERCVTKVLSHLDSRPPGGQQLRSVVMPLLGTGTGGGEVKPTAAKLLGVAVKYFEKHPDSTVDELYFLNYTKPEWLICEDLLRSNDKLSAVAKSRGTARRPSTRRPATSAPDSYRSTR